MANPNSSADTLSMSQQQMLASIQSLQDKQKDLMHQYASATNLADQKRIANEMDKNETIRSNLLKSIGSVSVVSNQLVANKTDESNNRKLLLKVANEELDAARSAMEETNQNQIEKKRMIELNTYYGKRFMAQAGVMKIFIYMCVPVLILAVLANMGFLPNYIAGFLIIAAIVVGIIYIYYAMSDINRRDEMNFDEYKWDFDPSRVGPIVHPHRHHKKKDSAAATGAAAGCTNDACCSSDTQWNPSTNKCDVQGDKSAVKGTSSHKVGKQSAASIASTAAPATGFIGDLSSSATTATTTVMGTPTATTTVMGTPTATTAPTTGPTTGPTSTTACWSYQNRTLKGSCMGDWFYNDATDRCNAPGGSAASQIKGCDSYKVSDMNADTVTPDIFASFIGTCKVADSPNCT